MVSSRMAKDVWYFMNVNFFYISDAIKIMLVLGESFLYKYG